MGTKTVSVWTSTVEISCVQAVFGKLVASANGNSGSIEEDPSKWEGTSDLHVCGYFSTLHYPFMGTL